MGHYRITPSDLSLIDTGKGHHNIVVHTVSYGVKKVAAIDSNMVKYLTPEAWEHLARKINVSYL